MICVGLDVHKRWTTAVVLDTDTGETVRFDRIANDRAAFEQALACWRGRLVGVMETGRNAWAMYDERSPLFEALHVCDAAEMERRCRGRGAKRDRRDALQMALVVAEGRVPKVAVPSQTTRARRALTRGRTAVVQMSTRVINQLRSLAASFGQESPDTGLRTARGRQWLGQLSLPAQGQLMLKQWRAQLELLETQRDPPARRLMSCPESARCWP